MLTAITRLSTRYARIPTARAVMARYSSDVSFSQEQSEQLRQVQESLKQKLSKDKEEMKKKFGESHADKLWMFDYYKHKQHHFLPAALSEAMTEPKIQLPTVASKLIVFYSQVLSQHPEQFQMYSAVLPLIVPDVPFLLALFKHVDGQAGKAAYQRIAGAVRKGGDEHTKEAAAHISQVPTQHVTEWPIPFLEPTFTESYKTKVLPHEIHPAFPHAKDQLDAQQYMLLSTTTLLECLWASFYATGSDTYVRRVMQIAQHWAEFSDLPDNAEYCLSLEKKLPDELTKASSNPVEMVRAVKAQMSRVAMWSLLAHSRRHPVVVETVADEVGRLAQHVVEPSARNPVKAALLSPEVARQRLEVYPAILALMARMTLDSPLEG